MDQDGYPVVFDVEQMMGLDHLQPFVEEGGGVDGYPGPHVPGRVGQGLVWRHPGQRVRGSAPERATGGGQDQTCHRFRLLAGEALKQGRMLAVDRDQLAAVLGQRPLHHRPTGHETLLVGQRHAVPALQTGHRRSQPGRSDDSVDDDRCPGYVLRR